MATGDFQVVGKNGKALFTLKVHRGEGMALLAMNWRTGKPGPDFVGFAIEYKEPGGDRFYALKNRLTFPWNDPKTDPTVLQSTRSPFQKFRWVHFPRNAELAGEFVYRVTPMFMNSARELSKGEPQEVPIVLARETYPGKLNVTFTRGFVSSQAFVDNYLFAGPIETLLPKKNEEGLDFTPTHSLTKKALPWMGFEARSAILEVLDQAIADKTAKVSVVAYDLNEPDLVDKLAKLGKRLSIAIDNNEKDHGKKGSAENKAEKKLRDAGAAVVRQHMGDLQHNKTIVVEGKVQKVVCGSTNFSWRGFFVQNNNAVVLTGATAVAAFLDAFAGYFPKGDVAAFGTRNAATWVPLGLAGIKAAVTFSPHSTANAVLQSISKDLETGVTSSLLYSLAFLYQTPGKLRDAITALTANPKRFVYGMSDKKVGGIEVQTPDGNLAPVRPQELTEDTAPEPFKSEPGGGNGIRLHHKFLVIDFDQPTARVYLGSYNFSSAADRKNGENLLLIKDRRIATAYAIEAVRIFDHYQFRLAQLDEAKGLKKLELQGPPTKPGDKPWFDEDWTVASKKRDREIFS